MIRRTQLNQQGFTIPELLTVMVMTVMFSGLIMYFTFQFWSSLGTLQSDSETYVSRLNAGDLLRDALNESSGLVIQNSIADSNALAPDPAIATNDFWEPIHAVPGNIANGGSGTYTPVIYFRRPSIDTSKNIIYNGVQPYEDEFVLYMNGTTKQLLLRTLANSSATNNRAKTSCPKNIATATCPADRIVAESVASVDTRYFSRSGNLINHHSIVDSITGEYIGPDYPVVEVVELNLHLSKASVIKGGQNTSNQTVIRVAIRSS